MKPRIAYLCSSTSWGGLEMNHLRNAKWMKDRGYDVLVIGVGNSPFANRAKSMDLPFKAVSPYGKYYSFGAALKMRKLLKNEQITHLLIRSNHDMSITATVKLLSGKKLTTAYFMEMQLGVKKTNLLHTIRYRFIDHWSCPLNWLAGQVKDMTRFRNNLVVIPSGLELATFTNAQSKSECRKLLDLPGDSLLFGLIGRFDRQKGQLLLLEAMKVSTHDDFSIVLLGEPTLNEGEDYHKEMQAFVAENELEKRVHIRPFRQDIATFYSSVDWLVMATKAETFGMVTIEALASGVPVLGSNAGGTPEILQNGSGGVLFGSLDTHDLARKIDQICGNEFDFQPDELRKMASVYDHEKVCDQVADLLQLS